MSQQGTRTRQRRHEAPHARAEQSRAARTKNFLTAGDGTGRGGKGRHVQEARVQMGSKAGKRCKMSGGRKNEGACKLEDVRRTELRRLLRRQSMNERGNMPVSQLAPAPTASTIGNDRVQAQMSADWTAVPTPTLFLFLFAVMDGGVHWPIQVTWRFLPLVSLLSLPPASKHYYLPDLCLLQARSATFRLVVSIMTLPRAVVLLECQQTVEIRLRRRGVSPTSLFTKQSALWRVVSFLEMGLRIIGRVIFFLINLGMRTLLSDSGTQGKGDTMHHMGETDGPM